MRFVAVVLAALAIAPAAQGAVSGSVKGVPKLTKAGGSVVAVGADGRIKGRAVLGSGLRYKLATPNLPQVLFADVFDLARGRSFSGHSPLFSPAKAPHMDVRAQAQGRLLQHRAAVEHNAATPPAVGVHGIDLNGSDGVLRNAASNMLITELVDPMRTRCKGSVVEVDPRLLAILRAEIALQRSKYVDPSTRVSFHPTAETHAVHGSGHYDNTTGNISVDITLTDLRTGRVVLRDRASGKGLDGFGKALAALAQRIAKEACRKKPVKNEFRVEIAGSVSESWSYKKTLVSPSFTTTETGSGSYEASFNTRQPFNAVLDEPPGIQALLMFGGAGALTARATLTGKRETTCSGDCSNFRPPVVDTSGCGSSAPTAIVGPVWDATTSTVTATLAIPPTVNASSCPMSIHELGRVAQAQATLTLAQLKTENVIKLRFHDVQHEGQPGGAVSEDSDDATLDWTITLTRVD